MTEPRRRLGSRADVRTAERLGVLDLDGVVAGALASILAAGQVLDEAHLDQRIAEWQVEERWAEARRFGR